MTDRNRPLYMIGVVAEMLEVHPQTLRFYEKKGLLRPSRSVGRTRMYSQEDVEELARLLRLDPRHGRESGRRRGHPKDEAPDGRYAEADPGSRSPTCARRAATWTSVAGRESRESLVKAAAGQLQPVDLF